AITPSHLETEERDRRPARTADLRDPFQRLVRRRLRRIGVVAVPLSNVVAVPLSNKDKIPVTSPTRAELPGFGADGAASKRAHYDRYAAREVPRFGSRLLCPPPHR